MNIITKQILDKFIQQNVPKGIIKKSSVFANEIVWQKDVIREVVDGLVQNRFAIAGCEIWIPEGDVPLISFYGSFNIIYNGSWNDYLKSSYTEMQKCLKIETPPNALYNLTIICENDN